MKLKYVLLIALFCPCLTAAAQSRTSIPYEVYAGYAYLSNSFNGVPGAHQPLNGFDAALSFPDWHRLRFKLDYSMFDGTNLGAPQHAFLILGGGQYEVRLGPETLFAEALVGEAGMNRNWYIPNGTGYKNGSTGTNASFAAVLGGGVDTPVSRHIGIRVEGGVQHTNFDPIEPLKKFAVPYHLAGIPNYFGRLSAGIVWRPRVEPAYSRQASDMSPESELIFEGLDSFGHFKIFANSWWSYLSVAGLEYDRHSWGRMIGARRDYSAEFLPFVLLRQPSKTDIWGHAKSPSHENVPGIGVSPIGMRLLWNDSGHVMPYYVIKGGVAGYTQKTFSQYASYYNFTLQQSLGLQFHMSGRWDVRTGFEVFHQSNGFVVPSNPGLDAMMGTFGLSYHLNRTASTE